MDQDHQIQLSISNNYFRYYHDTNSILQFINNHVICHYIKCKIRAINNEIRDSVKLKRRLNIRRMHSNLNSIYTEINEYNEIFFSKYYLSVWLFLGSLNTFLLYLSLLANIPLLYKMISFYAFLLTFTLFSIIILNASSVNTEANNSHKLLNSLYVCYFSAQIREISKYSLIARLKVSKVLFSKHINKLLL